MCLLLWIQCYPSFFMLVIFKTCGAFYPFILTIHNQAIQKICKTQKNQKFLKNGSDVNVFL